LGKYKATGEICLGSLLYQEMSVQAKMCEISMTSTDVSTIEKGAKFEMSAQKIFQSSLFLAACFRK
jgi:hypothetical protein